jgi:hypothetical protein
MQPIPISNQRPDVPSLAGVGALLFRCCSGRQHAVFAAKYSGADAPESLKTRHLVVSPVALGPVTRIARAPFLEPPPTGD